MIDKNKKPFFCIKLRSGETLMSEVTEFDFESNYVTMNDPFQIKSIAAENSNELITAVPWIPYIDTHIIKIDLKETFVIEHLNEKFIKFYASILIQTKISKIKETVADKMENRNDYYTMMEGLEMIKKMSAEISERFGVPNELDTSHFEEAAMKHRPLMN